MGEAEKAVIDVRNLKVEFPGRRGTVTPLSDISLSIRAGEILGVVGESGAGKSMTGQRSRGCSSGQAASAAAKSGSAIAASIRSMIAQWSRSEAGRSGRSSRIR